MPEPFAYLNGRFLPASELAIPVYDAGFVQGVTVSEQLRTFGGQLFRLEQHLDRLAHSLEIVGLDPGMERAELAKVAGELVAKNHRLLAAGDDLGLSLLVTPGAYPAFAPPGCAGPTVCLHTYPLPFHLWVDKYELGQRLVVTDIEQVPPACWPPELKCRSRMHYFLADRKADSAEPGARALLLDQRGNVIEASTANLVVYRRGEGIISPPRARILPGVSLAVLEELAAERSVPFFERDLTVHDVLAADEAILSSTSSCLLPAVSLNGQAIGNGRPGEMFQQALAAWSQLVGVDIRQQAARFAQRT